MAWYVGIFMILFTDDFAILFTASRVSTPLSCSICINFTNISAVQAASSTALWWWSKDILSAFATVSSLNLLSCGSRTRASATVSIMVGLHSIPCSSQFFLIKLISKSALWATMVQPLQNSINAGSIFSITGASITMSSRIDVSCSILNGIGTCGLTKVENLSTILPSFTFTAPISIILFTSGLKPVVSRSNTT